MFNLTTWPRANKACFRFIATFLAVVLVSCQSAPRAAMRAQSPVVLEETYTVGAPDILEISVYPQTELNQRVQVRPDGKISMNLIGDVAVEGLTPEEIDAKLTEELSTYLRGAEITVTVATPQSKNYYVIGEVNVPGVYSFSGQTSVLHAVMTAGSYTRRADTNRFILVRPSEEQPEVLDVDFKQVLTKGDASYDLYLKPGDILYVPPTGLAKAGYAIESLLFPFQPIIAPAGFALGIYAVADDDD